MKTFNPRRDNGDDAATVETIIGDDDIEHEIAEVAAIMVPIVNAATSGVRCRHCGKYRIRRARGLCWACYFKPDIRDLYPSASASGVGIANPRGEQPNEPTRARPGSSEKLRIMIDRAERGEALHHADDANIKSRVGARRLRLLPARRLGLDNASAFVDRLCWE